MHWLLAHCSVLKVRGLPLLGAPAPLTCKRSPAEPATLALPDRRTWPVYVRSSPLPMSGTGFPSKVLLCPGSHSRANRRYYGPAQRPSTGPLAGRTNPDESPPADLQDATLELGRVVLPDRIRHGLAVQANGALLDLP